MTLLHYSNYRIRGPGELALLTNCLPDGRLRDHWLNFRLNTSCDNFFDALQSHGWQWEDGTEFVPLDNWYTATACFVIGCLAFVTGNGNITFETCTSTYYNALCEYNLDRKFTMSPLAVVKSIGTSDESTSTNLSNNFYPFLSTQVEATEPPCDVTFNVTTLMQPIEAQTVSSSNQKTAVIPLKNNSNNDPSGVCVSIISSYEKNRQTVCML